MAGLVSEWITVSDFTPGIHGDFHGAGGTSAPGNTTRGAVMRDGAATIEHTYACRADASGALVPLPAKTQYKTQTLLPGGNANATSNYYPSAMIGAYLTDAMVTGPSTALPSVLYQWAYSTAGAGANYSWMILGRHYGSSTFDFMWESQNPATFSATSYSLLGGGLGSAFASRTSLFPVPFDNMDREFFVCFSAGLNHAAAAIVAGETPLTTYDADVSANYPTGTGANAGGTWIRGAINNQCTQTSGVTPTRVMNAPYMGITHQGRIVVANSISNGTFASIPTFQVHVGYVPPNDPLSTASTGMHGAFLADRGSLQGIGAMASLTADELLLIGQQGGALLVRGDVANPTIVQLPYVASTHGWTHYPANTPVGVVYLTAHGVYKWAGGDTSELISQQIEGTFWNQYASTETLTPNYATRGRLASWGKYVAVPNNYLYDTETQAWWRLVDPATNTSVPYSCYSVESRDNRMYAFPYKLTGTQNTVCDYFDPTTLAAAYSWRSQPLLQSRDRLFTAQQVEIVASNPTATASTVTVTLEGVLEDGTLAATRTITFTLTGSGTSGGRPQVIRKQIDSTDGGLTPGSFTARYIQFRVEASNATVAPKIMSLAFGTGDRSRVSES